MAKSEHSRDMINAARLTRTLRDKQAVAEVVGESTFHLSPTQGAEVIRGLGLGFTRAMWVLGRVRVTLAKADHACPTCDKLTGALDDELNHHDLLTFFKDLERFGV
ncbi:MAG: hypothetical protein OEO20_11480 [Gemmatimonadota bacterium]|nr:hypothetical protein [Gemmatimonadota bacterium]MDH3366526.1 hypothetical protein [Gemmatimonadota bacterium]MDH3478915.1 hypothetical protein [Gemmatimonadota bacterium]MDH3571154.1 hypothetical protein [Gemmatimonadota bacterium]